MDLSSELTSLESVRKCAAILLEQYDHNNTHINNVVSIQTKIGIKTAEGYVINFRVEIYKIYAYRFLYLEAVNVWTDNIFADKSIKYFRR